MSYCRFLFVYVNFFRILLIKPPAWVVSFVALFIVHYQHISSLTNCIQQHLSWAYNWFLIIHHLKRGGYDKHTVLSHDVFQDPALNQTRSVCVPLLSRLAWDTKC